MVPEGSQRLFLFPFGAGLIPRLCTRGYTHLFLTVEEEMWLFLLAFSSADLECIGDSETYCEGVDMVV